MRKSNLQKEFARQVRIIEKQLKELETQGITFNPAQIEAVTKKRTRLKKSDIEELKLISSTLEDQLLPRASKKIEQHSSRTKKPDVDVSQSRKKLSDEELKEHRNFRARVRRLEKQGYDTSQIKPTNAYTLEELKALKRGELSKLATKNGETAYDIRNREANEKRQQTKRLRERIREIYKQEPPVQMETLRPRELGDYVDVGRGALTDRFHAPSIIEELLMRFKEQDNFRKLPLEEHKSTLIGMFYDIITEHDDESDGLLQYEDYLQSIKGEVLELSTLIYWASSEEQIDTHYTNLMALLNHNVLTEDMEKRLSEINENIYYD